MFSTTPRLASSPLFLYERCGSLVGLCNMWQPLRFHRDVHHASIVFGQIGSRSGKPQAHRPAMTKPTTPHEWEAAQQFMRAVKDIKPEVLSDLRDNVRSQSRREGSVVTIFRVRPSDALMAWARRWHFQSSLPIIRWAQEQVSRWSRASPGRPKSLWLEPTSLTHTPWEPYPCDLTDPLSHIAADPQRERLPTFLKRARKHYRARKVAGRPSRKGEIRRIERFEWLARRVLLGQSVSKIVAITEAKGVVFTHDAVRKGIERSKSDLGLDLTSRR